MNYQEWRSAVENAMGRSDVPAYVYTLAQRGVNRDMRLLEMEGETTLTPVDGVMALPSDFGSAVSVIADSSGSQFPLGAVAPQAGYNSFSPSIPQYYTISDGELRLHPIPDGNYTVILRYVRSLPMFAVDNDTNDIIARYPDLYIYAALAHAAVWAKDTESAQTYDAAYTSARENARKDDMRRRAGTPIHPRSRRL